MTNAWRNPTQHHCLMVEPKPNSLLSSIESDHPDYVAECRKPYVMTWIPFRHYRPFARGILYSHHKGLVILNVGVSLFTTWRNCGTSRRWFLTPWCLFIVSVTLVDRGSMFRRPHRDTAVSTLALCWCILACGMLLLEPLQCVFVMHRRIPVSIVQYDSVPLAIYVDA